MLKEGGTYERTAADGGRADPRLRPTVYCPPQRVEACVRTLSKAAGESEEAR